MLIRVFHFRVCWGVLNIKQFLRNSIIQHNSASVAEKTTNAPWKRSKTPSCGDQLQQWPCMKVGRIEKFRASVVPATMRTAMNPGGWSGHCTPPNRCSLDHMPRSNPPQCPLPAPQSTPNISQSQSRFSIDFCLYFVSST